jgi:methylphosphotriester-DNA--protein-cysteine methyltransferase
MTRYATIFLFLATLAVPTAIHAGEADDLQRQIDYLKQTTSDLERQDEQKTVATDVTFMKSWLDTAWTLRSQEKYDEVRGLLDRCEAQAQMIRQLITAAKMNAQATAKENDLRKARTRLANTKKAVENAKINKARLEGKV